MLARFQQGIAATLLLLGLAWGYWTLPKSPMAALAGFGLLALGHALFLALEFVAVYVVNRQDSVPHAGLRNMVKAWVGESITAPKVFLWRQPFRSNSLPDQVLPGEGAQGARGIVFIHGFVCNRGFWNPWIEQLSRRGNVFIAVNLEPVFGSISDYVPIIEDAVSRVTAATGQPPLVVCHSMGGLAIRAWLRANAANGLSDDRVHRIVTIGSPHHGTWLSRFAFSVNGSQMRRPELRSRQASGAWLERLSGDEPKGRSNRFLCFYSNCDNIVFPASTAMLDGADNRLVNGLAHVDMAFDEQVMRQTLALLTPQN